MADIDPSTLEDKKNVYLSGLTPVLGAPKPLYDPEANQSFGQNFYDAAIMTPTANFIRDSFAQATETGVRASRGGGFYGREEQPAPPSKFDLTEWLADNPDAIEYAYKFGDVHNREYAENLWGMIKTNEDARRRIEKNDSFWAQAAAELVDPVNYIPGTSMMRGVGVVRGFVRGMGAAVPSMLANEAIRQTYDPTATLDESKTNLINGTLMIGAIGGAVGFLRKPITTIAKNLNDETRILVGDPLTDAPDAIKNSTLADNAPPLTSVAQGVNGTVRPWEAIPTGDTPTGPTKAGFIGDILKYQGPFARLGSSGFRVWEDLANRFAGDNGIQWARNEIGVPTEQSAWLAAKRLQNEATDLRMKIANHHANYIMGSTGKTADAFGINLTSFGVRTRDAIRSKLNQSRPDGKLLAHDFDREVLETYWKAQETGVIEHDIPEIVQAANDIKAFQRMMRDQGIKSGYLRTPQNMASAYARNVEALNPAVTEWRSLLRNKNKTDQQIALQENLKIYIQKLVGEMKYSRPKLASVLNGRSSLRLASVPTTGANDNIEKVLIDPPMRDIKVQYGPTGKTRPDGTPVNAFYNETDKTVFFDYEATIASFNSKPWTKPKVEGVDPLPENAFETPEEWAEFVLRHELNHTSIRPFSSSGIDREAIVKYIDSKKRTNKFPNLVYHSTPDPDGIIKNGFISGGATFNAPIAEQGYGDFIAVFDVSGLNLEKNGKAFDPASVEAEAAWLLEGQKPVAVISATEMPNYWASRSVGTRAEDLGYEVSEASLRTSIEGSYLRGEDITKNPRYNELFVFGADKEEILRDLEAKFEDAAFVENTYKNYGTQFKGMSKAEYENLINRTSLEQMDDISNTHKTLGMTRSDARLVAANENVEDTSNFDDFYFEHRWRPDLIRGNEEKLEQIFFDHFVANPNPFEKELLSRVSVIDELKSKLETAKKSDVKKLKRQLKQAEEAKVKLDESRGDDAIRLRAKAAVENIMKHGEPFIGEGPIPVGSGRAFFAKRRVIDIPTSKIKEFIETDLNASTKYYTHRMGIGSEYTAAFGTPDGELAISQATIQSIRESEGKSLAEINDMVFKNEDDIRTLRDHNMNRYHQADQFGKEEAKILRSWFTLSSQGMGAFASMAELARPFMVLGFKENLEVAFKALGNTNRLSTALKEIRDETTYYAEMAQGDTFRRFVDSGMDSFGGLTNKYNSVLQKIERPLAWAQTPFFFLNGLSILTYFQKTHTGLVASSVFCKRILRAANGTANEEDITFLASYGISKEDAILMAKEPIEKDGGVIFANTREWSNQELGKQYYRAVDALIGRTIVTSSAADKPSIAMGIVGRGLDKKEVSALALPFQLKTWSLSANNKVLLSALQGRDANAKSGIIMMVGIAYYVNSLRVPDYVWDKMSEEEKIANAIDSSGILALASDVNFMAEQISGMAGHPLGARPLFGIKPKMGDPDFADAVSVFGGPALGKATDIWLALNNGTPKQKARAIVNSLPGQNMLFWSSLWKKPLTDTIEQALE